MIVAILMNLKLKQHHFLPLTTPLKDKLRVFHRILNWNNLVPRLFPAWERGWNWNWICNMTSSITALITKSSDAFAIPRHGHTRDTRCMEISASIHDHKKGRFSTDFSASNSCIVRCSKVYRVYHRIMISVPKVHRTRSRSFHARNHGG